MDLLLVRVKLMWCIEGPCQGLRETTRTIISLLLCVLVVLVLVISGAPLFKMSIVLR